MPTTTQLREAMARYAEAASSKDADRYAALFTPDAVQVDPYPSGVHNGPRRDPGLHPASFDACEAMTFEVEECHPVADKAAIRFHITLGLEGGATMHIRGVEVFTSPTMG